MSEQNAQPIPAGEFSKMVIDTMMSYMQTHGVDDGLTALAVIGGSALGVMEFLKREFEEKGIKEVDLSAHFETFEKAKVNIGDFMKLVHMPHDPNHSCDHCKSENDSNNETTRIIH